MSETHSFFGWLCAFWTTSEQEIHLLDNVIDPQALLMPRATASDNSCLTSNLVTTKAQVVYYAQRRRHLDNLKGMGFVWPDNEL